MGQDGEQSGSEILRNHEIGTEGAAGRDQAVAAAVESGGETVVGATVSYGWVEADLREASQSIS